MLEIIIYNAILVIIAFVIWYDRFSGNKNHETFKNMPGPPALPLIGNGHQFVGGAVHVLNMLNECWHKYGRRVRTVLGHDVLLLMSDPKDVEVLLSSPEHLDKSTDYKYLHVWLGQGLLTSTGERWRQHRKLLTPSFHFKILRYFVPIFDRCTDTFVRSLAEHANGQPVDVYPLVTRCTLDQLSETYIRNNTFTDNVCCIRFCDDILRLECTISESAMGTSTEEQTDENLMYVDAVKQLSKILNNRMNDVLIRSDILFRLTSRYAVFVKALKVVQEYTTSMIRQRKRVLSERGVDLDTYTKEQEEIGQKKCVAFLDLLLLSALDGKTLDDIAIKNEVDTFLFEGHDTTASGISFTMYVLASNPEIQDKLYEEQQEIFADQPKRATEFRDLQEMKYMELVLKEALRIYPPVPIIARNIKKDFKINDMLIPAGTDIAVNIFNMNRDPDVFPDPMKVIPERFLSEHVSKRNPYSNVTFSAGPRNCIGQKFAMYEMKMTLSKLIRHYRFSSADAPPLVLAGDLTLKSANGIHVRIHKR